MRSRIKKKLDKLRNYKIYDYSVFSKEDLNAAMSYISRAVKRGGIIMIGKGEFFKKDPKNKNKIVVTNKPFDKEAIKRDCVRADKYPRFKPYFWSNPEGEFSVYAYVAIALKGNCMADTMHLCDLFGDAMVYRAYLNEYYARKERLDLVESRLGII